MAGEIIRYELKENVAVLNFDDGTANVIGLDSIAALEAVLGAQLPGWALVPVASRVPRRTWSAQHFARLSAALRGLDSG